MSIKINELVHEYFVTEVVTNQTQRNELFSLRYDVYVEEFGFENINDFPDRLESDEYDNNSILFILRHKPTNKLAGCFRIITDHIFNDKPLPFVSHIPDSVWIKFRNKYGRHAISEISRIAVAKEFRQRHSSPKGVVSCADTNIERLGGKRVLSLVAPVMYFTICHACKLFGIHASFAMMEKSLARRLCKVGIKFNRVGPEVEYHGKRAAYHIDPRLIVPKSSLFKEISNTAYSMLVDCLPGSSQEENGENYISGI